MKTGIIGLPQVGKTSLFRILTKAHLSDQAYANPREAHIGVAKVPDERLDRLAALYNPRKLTHASVEYVDVGAIGGPQRERLRGAPAQCGRAGARGACV
jgi:ribosome-binding ATPase